jgi:membrane protease subunit HflC
MKNLPIQALLAAIAAGLFMLLQAVFIVPESRSAIVLQFGQPVAQYTSAGLAFKVPFLQNRIMIDKRNRELDQPAVEIIASNQERLNVDAFARYRVINPLLFYQTVGGEAGGDARMTAIMENAVRRVLGEASVDDIVSNRRGELMRRISDLLQQGVRPIGVEIIDVKIRRADLPEQNSQAVYGRMITERAQLAQQIRAEGAEEAQKIRAQAERRRTEILATAEEESQKVRGAADANRNSIFAAAYGRDPEFFAFYRSLNSYETALKGQNGETTILLSPNSEFLRYLDNQQGRRR